MFLECDISFLLLCESLLRENLKLNLKLSSLVKFNIRFPIARAATPQAIYLIEENIKIILVGFIWNGEDNTRTYEEFIRIPKLAKCNLLLCENCCLKDL